MAERPTGTVTFLFTDIEGSTRLWEEHPQAMREALAQHDELLRTKIEAGNGFVHSTAGDAFSAAFSDPADAISTAIEAQRVLGEADWPEVGQIRVRMAVHTGVAHERAGDYYGPALNRCARILSTAHGQQIVTSRGTEELVRHRMTPGTSLRDLGEHRLKDLGHPEQIFQVVAPGLRQDFAALRTLDPRLNNLPLQLTSFVGREDELRDVKKRLTDTRLLTLTGVGGSGKTRLSLQVAAETAEEYADGVWLVELAAVSDPDRLAAWVAETLRINKGQGGVGSAALAGEAVPVIDQIVEYLKRRGLLLILDNCEHLIGAAADLSTYLLQACPDLKIMATSREGLGISGETLWQVPSLEMPSRYDQSEIAGTGADALRLFADRAAAVNPNFRLDEDSFPHVLKICRRLDGMPLAIELAAARARSLDVARIADRLDDRFRLLTGGSRTALPRQQTLAAAVEWSYDLLEVPEQLFFQRLAAFRGGFTLEAAEQVCVGGDVDELDVVDHLSSLVDKSMVVWEGGSGDRYRLLETLRQYAMGKLKDQGDADDTRQAHAEYFLDVAETAAPHLRQRDQVEWIERLEADHENFRAALAFTDEHDQSRLAARMAAALSWFWNVRNHREEQQEWLGPLLGREDIGEDETVLKLMMAYGWFLLYDGQFQQVQPHLADTIGLAERLEDKSKLAEVYVMEGWLQQNLDDYEAAEKAHELALGMALEAHDDWAAAWAHYGRGWVERMRANVDAAAPHFDKAITGMRKIGDTLGLSWAAGVSAILARYRLDYESARRYHEQSLEGFLSLGDQQGEAFTYACLGIIDYLEGNFEESIANHRKAEDLERDIGQTGAVVAENLQLMADSQRAAGHTEDALETLGEAIEILENERDQTEAAQVLEVLSKVALQAEDADSAARMMAWASRIREEVGRAQPPPSRPEYAELDERIAAAASDPAALAAEGAAWSYEEAIAAARTAITSRQV